MIRTGLRRSEVLNVRVDDIVDGNDGAYVRVRQGKGRKDRIVPLDTAHDRFSRKLLRYIRTHRPQDAGDPHLWLSTRRNAHSGTYTPFDVRGLTSMLAAAERGARASMSHPHKFRHTFGSRALVRRRIRNLLALQRALWAYDARDGQSLRPLPERRHAPRMAGSVGLSAATRVARLQSLPSASVAPSVGGATRPSLMASCESGRACRCLPTLACRSTVELPGPPVPQPPPR